MKKIFLSTLIILFLSSLTYGETMWRNVTSGIDEREFNGVSVAGDHPGIAYVATSRGIYKTKDSGTSWRKSLYLGSGKTKANFVVIHPRDSKIVYAATDKGLYRTENSGRDWERIFSGIGRKKIVRCIALDTTNLSNIYIGTETGLFKSENSGRDWQRSIGLLAKLAVYQIAIHPTKPRVIYAVSDKGLFKSKDGGSNWKGIFTYVTAHENNNQDYDEAADEEDASPPKARSVVIDTFDPHKIYLGTEEGIFESSDEGLAWRQFTDHGLVSKKVNFLLVSPIEPNDLYAATEKGIYRFSKDRNSWLELYPDIGMQEVRFIACDLDRDNSVWITTENGVYKTAQEMNEVESTRLETYELLAYFKDEPSIHEVQEAAIRYAEVYPEKIEEWRRGAMRRALLPTLKFDMDKDRDEQYHWASTSEDNYSLVAQGPDKENLGWGISLEWDLADLIWNPSQTTIDIRSKLMVQLRDDILDEVTRYYFERRKLQIELLQSPPKDTRSRIRKELRLQELTANIDALTGGYLSECLQ